MQNKTRELTLLGILFGLALILSFLESLMPPAPFLPPGVKLGLSNIITMYCLLYLGIGQAYSLALLKAGFVLITRGAVAGVLSVSGGILSVSVMVLMMRPKKWSVSVFLLSVFGAVSHNLGQLMAASLLIGETASLFYLPILILSGVGMGAVTGGILRIVLPASGKLQQTLRKEA